MKVDHNFASRVAELAAQMVADGWPHGTFENPESELPVGVNVEVAMQRAAHHIWGGPGWWRGNMSRAEECLRSIRHQICDDDPDLSLIERGRQAKARWDELDVDEQVLMLLICSQALKKKKVETRDAA